MHDGGRRCGGPRQELMHDGGPGAEQQPVEGVQRCRRPHGVLTEKLRDLGEMPVGCQVEQDMGS